MKKTVLGLMLIMAITNTVQAASNSDFGRRYGSNGYITMLPLQYGNRKQRIKEESPVRTNNKKSHKQRKKERKQAHDQAQQSTTTETKD